MRIVKGAEPISPRTDLSVAENFVYMMSGAEPDATACAALNVYLVLLAEHGMNASTFTTRVVTATGSDMHSAIVAGIGALKGSLSWWRQFGRDEYVSGNRRCRQCSALV